MKQGVFHGQPKLRFDHWRLALIEERFKYCCELVLPAGDEALWHL